MSIAPRLKDWLEEAESQGHLSPLSTATTLPALVMAALHIGLMMARWLLESELEGRAHAPQSWPSCPHCGSRLHSKGFQGRQMQTLVGPIA